MVLGSQSQHILQNKIPYCGVAEAKILTTGGLAILSELGAVQRLGACLGGIEQFLTPKFRPLNRPQIRF